MLKRGLPLLLVLLAACARPDTRPAFVMVDETVAEAPDVAGTLRPYHDQLAAGFSQVLARSEHGLGRRGSQAPLGQWVADAMRARASAILGEPVDVAITNSGGLRAELPQGDITMRHIYEVLPFDNALVVGECTGAELRALALGAGTSGSPFSGLRLKLSGTREAPVLDSFAFSDGRPVDPAATYRVATSDYLLRSGNEVVLKGLRHVKACDLSLRQVALDAAESLGKAGKALDWAADGRLDRPREWDEWRDAPSKGHR